jgi:hypothetical protein
MLKAIILVCSLSTPMPDCDEASALDVLRTPVLSALPGRCMMLGQAYLAELWSEMRAGDYPLVRCVRHVVGRAG